MKTKTCGIYKITSTSGKIYIGQSVDIEDRWKCHKKHQEKGQSKLYSSLRKHGIENHIFEIIEECLQELLNEREVYWIKYFDSFGTHLGLNLVSGGLGGRPSEETKKRQSEAAKGNTSASGKRTEETVKKLSDAAKGNTNASGTRTEEQIKRMSDAGKKKAPPSEETKKKISTKLSGRTLTEEHRKNQSKAAKGRKSTPC